MIGILVLFSAILNISQLRLIFSLDVRYQNTSQMLDALAAKTVDVVFMDTFSMQNLQPILDKRSMKVAEMIDTNSGYGIELTYAW